MERDENALGEQIPRRAAQLILGAALALALAGLAVGFAANRNAGAPPVSSARMEPEDAGVPAAPTYAEMPAASVRANDGFRSRLATLAATPAPAPDLPQPRAMVEESVRARAQRRAFHGAPPVIPHPADSLSVESCLACHGSGLRIGERNAPRIPHERYASCTQCHVEQQSAGGVPFEFVPSEFRGIEAPAGGSRSGPFAPPTIPHSTWMHENCSSCHGPHGPEGLRTSHPERQSCTQCHAPDARLSQGLPVDGPRFLTEAAPDGP